MPQFSNADPHPKSNHQRWFILLVPTVISIFLLLISYNLMNAADTDQSLAPEFNPPLQDGTQPPTSPPQMEKSFDSNTVRHTQSVAWADYDGDGDLDLAVGNGSFLGFPQFNMINQLYVNLGGGNFREDDIRSDAFNTTAVTWGDWDGDGDSDLAVANDAQPNQVYENVLGTLRLNWSAPVSLSSTSLAWGDWDGDGDLDLAVGNDNAPNQVYRNISDTLQLSWESPITGPQQTTGIAWADWDNDGDLDLAFANYDGPDQIFENDNDSFQWDPDIGIGWQSEPIALADSLEENCVTNRPWQGQEDLQFEYRTRSLAWGDWNNDGFIDLATGGGSNNNDCGAFIRVYTNFSGTLQLDDQVGWEWADQRSEDKPASLAWGDWDNDGDLDLAVGSNAGSGWGIKNRIYENDGGEFKFDLPEFGWESNIDPSLFAENTYAVAFGDADGDGDLDLAVGNGGRFNGGQNNAIVATTAPVVALAPEPWLSPDAHSSSSAAWGDWDNDGDLDLAVGNVGEPNQIYENEDGQLFFDLAKGLGWQSTVITNDMTTSLAWGDWDNDGDLDLAVGNILTDYVYLNDNGTLTLTMDGQLGWVSEQISPTQSIAWGDWDRDGDLDLAAGHCDTSQDDSPVLAFVYENSGNGNLIVDPGQDLGWISPEPLCAKSVGWGDWDGDGDLDLALGARVYENDANRLILNTRQGYGWDGQVDAESVAWGDMDGDGDLDLAVGLWDKNRVYENISGMLWFAPNGNPKRGWVSRDTQRTTSVAWGDVDGDEDLDLAVANTAFWGHAPNQIYENKNNTLSDRGVWRSEDDRLNPDGELYRSQDIAWGDIDNDGDLDLAVANQCLYNQCSGPDLPNQVYINNLQGSPAVAGSATPLISIDEPYSTSSADFYASPEILSSTSISLPYTLRNTNGVPVGQIKVFFSLDGGDRWKVAVPLTGTQTTNLETSADGITHIFNWNTFASNFFGQSDNVVIRMIAYPSPPIGTDVVSGTYRYFNQTAGSELRPSVSDTSFPFRVQSTQIKVITGDGSPLSGAYVFRLPEGRVSGAELMPSQDRPLQTDDLGLLAGDGEIAAGDRLVALYQVDVSDQISFTNKYRFFYTSGSPTDGGLEMYKFEEPEIIELQISDENPLLIFDLDIALEWDVRNEPEFQLDLIDGIKRASELLYDVSDGQIALGNVRIYHGKEYWPSVDVLVLANNSLRPLAPIGGVVQFPLSETVKTLTGTKVISNAYVNSQIKMGTVWDPFGESNTDLGPDWWQALAHELAHYLLFLPDDYLGFKDEDSLGKINCHGSFMTSTYDPEFSELLTEDKWNQDDECLVSLAERTTGRPDWKTVTKFYGMLNEPDPGLAGPRNLPLEVTNVFFVDPFETRSTLRARNFEVRDNNLPNAERLRLPAAQAYLFQRQGTADLSDDVLIQLGTPTGGGDRLKVRGAFDGDRLCLFDRSGSQDYAGCELLDSADIAINVAEVHNNWQPNIEINPVTSRTMQITVTQAVSDGTAVNVQMFPNHYWSTSGYFGLSPAAVMVSDGDTHTKTLDLGLPAYDVAVRVWVEGDPGRETIDQFRLNPPWETTDAGPNSGFSGGPNSGFSGGPNSGFSGGPNSGFSGGPNSGFSGGPNSGFSGGPNSGFSGGPNSGFSGGPNSGFSGGPNSGFSGGPNSGFSGGAQRQTFNAPILSADAQVVIYNRNGLFEDNGVDTLQILDRIPSIDDHPWLVPVGQAYNVRLNPSISASRIIALTYLQRDVPDGYEHTLNIYFLPAGESEWQRLDTKRYIENLVVAELEDSNGTYAVMSTIQMPDLAPGWNLFSYPLPDSRTVTDTLKSIESVYERIRYDESAVKPGENDESNVSEFEFGKVYWIFIGGTEAVTPYLAPPKRTVEGVVPGS